MGLDTIQTLSMSHPDKGAKQSMCSRYQMNVILGGQTLDFIPWHRLHVGLVVLLRHHQT